MDPLVLSLRLSSDSLLFFQLLSASFLTVLSFNFLISKIGINELDLLHRVLGKIKSYILENLFVKYEMF